MRWDWLLCGALSLASCGGGTTEALSPEERLDGIGLPTIGTVGDFPDPSHRHVVNVAANGRIVIQGREFAFAALRGELERRAQSSSEPSGVKPGQLGPERQSAESIVLRVDGSLPWGATAALLFECERARLPRTFFAVRHESDGTEGGFAFRLPMCDEVPAAFCASVRLHARPGTATPLALYSHIVNVRPTWMRESPALFDDAGRFEAEVDADVRLPTSDVLEFLDAMLRASSRIEDLKLGNLYLVLSDDESTVWFRKAQTTPRLPPGPRDVRIRRFQEDLPVPALPHGGTMPPEPRVRGEVRGLLDLKQVGSTGLAAEWR